MTSLYAELTALESMLLDCPATGDNIVIDRIREVEAEIEALGVGDGR